MFFTLMGYWGIGIPLDVLLPFPLGLDGIGIWTGLALGLAIVACLMIRWWRHREALGPVLPRWQCSWVLRCPRVRTAGFCYSFAAAALAG